MIQRRILLTNIFFNNLRLLRWNNTFTGTKTIKIYDEENENDPRYPVKFSSSEAAGWRAGYSRIGEKPTTSSDLPSWKFWSCWASYVVFIVYALSFRERNDLDEEMEMPLGKRLLLLREGSLLKERAKAVQENDSVDPYDSELAKINQLRVKYGYISPKTS